MTKHPKPGQRITYINFGGERLTLVVENVYDDVKNGRPGFDGRTTRGEDVWGYTDQIV